MTRSGPEECWFCNPGRCQANTHRKDGPFYLQSTEKHRPVPKRNCAIPVLRRHCLPKSGVMRCQFCLFQAYEALPRARITEPFALLNYRSVCHGIAAAISSAIPQLGHRWARSLRARSELNVRRQHRLCVNSRLARYLQSPTGGSRVRTLPAEAGFRLNPCPKADSEFSHGLNTEQTTVDEAPKFVSA